jgi:hypothetical protein
MGLIYLVTSPAEAAGKEIRASVGEVKKSLYRNLFIKRIFATLLFKRHYTMQIAVKKHRSFSFHLSMTKINESLQNFLESDFG